MLKPAFDLLATLRFFRASKRSASTRNLCAPMVSISDPDFGALFRFEAGPNLKLSAILMFCVSGLCRYRREFGGYVGKKKDQHCNFLLQPVTSVENGRPCSDQSMCGPEASLSLGTRRCDMIAWSCLSATLSRLCQVHEDKAASDDGSSS
jgi:hypothetical protein